MTTPHLDALTQATALRRYEKAKPHLINHPDILHLGIGAKQVGNQTLREWAIRVYVKVKKPLHALATSNIIPSMVEGLQTDVIEAPQLVEASCPEDEVAIDSARYRKTGFRGGIQIRNQHFGEFSSNGFGTLGCFGRTVTGGKLVGLSCAHVVNENAASMSTTGTKVGQPKIYKSSCCDCTTGEIGTVLKATKNTLVDCATIEIKDTGSNLMENKVRGKDAADGSATTVTISGVAEAQCFEYVWKRGRTTGYTEGQIIDLRYKSNQILIERTDKAFGTFACKGDSGSVIINMANKVVGLLTMVDKTDPKRGMANHIGPVMTELGIKIANQSAPATGVPATNCSTVMQLSAPAALERTQNAKFEVVNAPQGTTFSNWQSFAGTHSFQRPTNNSSSFWEGPMAITSEVRVDATHNGNTTTLRARTKVNARPWKDTFPQVPIARTPGYAELPHHPKEYGHLGVTIWPTKSNDDLWSDAGTGSNYSGPAVGPNTNWLYVKAPFWVHGVKTYANDGMYDPTHPIYKAHSRQNPRTQFTRYSITKLVEEVEAHEGIIVPPSIAPPGYRSHWQVAVDWMEKDNGENSMNRALEGVVVYNDSPNMIDRLQSMAEAVFETMQKQMKRVYDVMVPAHPETFHGALRIYFYYPYIEQRDLTNKPLAEGLVSLTVSRGTQPFTWTSDNTNIATVDVNGRVTPLTTGTVKIKVLDTDGDEDEVSITFV